MSLDPKLISAAVSGDEDTKRRVRTLVNNMLTYAEEAMEYGTPAVKAALIKTAIPAMIKEMREEKAEDETITLLRQEVRTMYEEMQRKREGEGTMGDNPPIPLLPSDKPLRKTGPGH